MLGGGTWLGHLTADWNIDDNPNGGYALSVLLKALLADGRESNEVKHQDPVSLSTHYLRPAISDADASMTAETLRIGRRTTTARGTLTQQEKQRITTVATFADLDEWQSDHPSFTPAPPEMPGPDDCVARAILDQGVDLNLMSRVEVRTDPDFVEPGSRAEASTRGWIRFVDDAAPTTLSLPLFADCFPPSVFTKLGPVGWVPTVELTVHVRRKPVDGWIQASFDTEDFGNGLLIENGLLWDESGALVAQSRQLALVL